jgi:hypothetical protein
MLAARPEPAAAPAIKARPEPAAFPALVATAPAAAVRADHIAVPREPAQPDEPVPFAAWLLDQSKRSGTLGELARAAKLDRAFPGSGSADDVRARFNAAGADGDAFEALDDAEREYDQLW